MPTAERIETDVLIAGAGPAGSTYARWLVSAGKKVVMTDTGVQFSPRPGVPLKNSFAFQRNMGNFVNIIRGLLHPISVSPNSGVSNTLDPLSYRPLGGFVKGANNPNQRPDRNLDSAAAAYSVGGMLLHWTGAVPRHHPKMERIQFISDDEWNDLYGRAEELLNKHTDVYSKSVRNTIVREALQAHYHGRLDPDYPVQELPMGAERRKDNDELVNFTGTDHILGPLLDDPERFGSKVFSILPQHRVKRLVMKNGRVEYAEVEDLVNWRTLHVYAETFIVACGTVMSAQLLWNSDIRPDALGRYLIEHPIAFTQVVLSKALMHEMDVDPRFKGQPRDPADPVPLPINDPPPNIWIPVQKDRPWHCQITKDAFAYGGLPADIDDRLVVDLRWFAIIDPVETNRVTFDDQVHNEFGMPQPTFDFTYGESDAMRMHDMMKDMAEAAQSLGGFFPGSEPKFMPSGICLHVQGTCRMGEVDDGKSVVDPHLKVWGIDNLYVGGNSVIPTANGSNPTLTNVALATRSARSIIAKGSSAKDEQN